MSISLVYETHELQNSTAMLLAEAGYIVNQTFPRQSQWINSTRQQPPAILVIVVNNPDHTLLQQLLTFQEQPVCPVIVIGKQVDATISKSIMEAGVDCCLNLRQLIDQGQHMLTAASIRFQILSRLHNIITNQNNQIESLEARLDERRNIDRAKGLLMRSYDMNEADAYNAMQRMAMDSGNKLSDVAHYLISIDKVLN